MNANIIAGANRGVYVRDEDVATILSSPLFRINQRPLLILLYLGKVILQNMKILHKHITPLSAKKGSNLMVGIMERNIR